MSIFHIQIKENDGPYIREEIQDKIHKWLLDKRDPASGEYPELPEESDGGSKLILFPAPVLEDETDIGEQAKEDKSDNKSSPSKKKEGCTISDTLRNQY